MSYKIAICDDSDTDREYIASVACSWAEQYSYDIQLKFFTCAEEFLFSYEEENDFDILLLDIEMGKIDGVTMAKKIRQDNDSIQIIFITGYSDYISEGYEVDALHYLMKPVKEEKLFEVLNRAVEKLSHNERVLFLNTGSEMVRVALKYISYADVQGNYVTIHAKENHTVKMTLSELEQQLDERFYRVGRSIIVNLTFIRKVTKKEIFLSDGSVLPLPRGAYEPLNRAIITHI